MKIFIDNETESKNVKKIIIENGEVEFRIQIDKFGNLIINKQQYGDGESELIIVPSVSNEIRIK